jgi:predicted transcriptional regulator
VEILEVVERVAGKIAPGRSPLFTEAHVVKALEEINTQKGVGRLKLSKELQLGEGAARTLVKHLKNERLIEISKLGITLSEYGKRIFSDLRAVLSEQIEVPSSLLTVGLFNVAILVRGRANAVKYGLEQRDVAIMAGAKGATTLVFSKNKLTMPSSREEDVFKGNLTIRNLLLSKLNPKEGDVIIIGSADEKIRAEFGAKMAAIQLLKTLSNS